MYRKIFLACLLVAALVLFTITDHPRPRPEFVKQLEQLRPVIVAAAQRHNHPVETRISDQDFAVVVALILYNENLGWVDERVTALRLISPTYQALQSYSNWLLSTNFTVWPSNLRPSVALEILNQQLPVKAATHMVYVPVRVFGTKLEPLLQRSQRDIYGAINEEITQPNLAIEYLAANLERGIYRAEFEQVPFNWQALLAWHLRGIVSEQDILHNQDALNYTQRMTYLADACTLIYPDTPPPNSVICGGHAAVAAGPN